uniref:Uncharacterized protein n=1 Tax=Candidatus Kentrum sp. FM TaxID=2126340 RepID=A0A450RV21_9GAMM|nr:MAG: Protein of unknown function (DUF2590) [Candidatus Kentron sp. FM]VFJ43698.1 MAG: Protein of unknown function (DUF2590) [Candidatus Kentron sp. FM]VFK05688.1 MAG: Protein of unknown function (DUF2590) [Candidatus Kentron sp. FM]
MLGDTDLWITGDDLTLDDGKEAQLIIERRCIAQDLIHMIREKGYAVRMVGERDPIQLALLIQEIEREMDEDVRIVPGTSRLHEREMGVYYATADTVEYDPIYIELTNLA